MSVLHWRTRVTIASLLLIAALALGAPGVAAQEGEVLACNGEPLGDPDLEASIEVWYWTPEILEPLVPAFNTLYPNVEVKIVGQAWSETHDKAAVAIAAGEGAPDVLAVDGGYIQKFIQAGGLADLSEAVGPCADFFPAYKIAEATGADGHLYAIPWDMGPVGLFYRADLWEEYGFGVPQTWDEFIEQGKQFAEDGHKMLDVAIEGQGGTYLFSVLLHQLGGSYFDAEGAVTVNSDAAVQAMTLVRRMVDEGITADVDLWSPGWAAGWKDGTLIANVGPAWMVHVFPDNIAPEDPTYGSWRVAALPGFEENGTRTANWGGSNLVIPGQSENQEAALAFALFAVGSVEGQVTNTLAGNISAYLPALEDPRVANATDPIYGDQKIYALFRELAPDVPETFYRPAPFYEALVSVMLDVTPRILTDEISVEEGLAEAQTRIEEVAAKYQ